MSAKAHPRLCIVGPLVGSNPGYVQTIGDRWIEMFRAAGLTVLAASHSTNRWVRLFDIPLTVRRARGSVDLLWVIVYGGRSFVVEDLASRMGRAAGIPTIMSLHGGAMPEFMARYPNWTRRVLSRSRALIVPSGYLARSLETHGFGAEVIPNIIDVAAYPFRHRRCLSPRLLWMRAFHSLYHPEMAIRVLARVRKSRPDATLVMAGQDLGLEGRVRRLAGDMGLADSVRFAGFLDMDGKCREGDTADIFINTNRVDNQPVSVIEACAMGLPVVATSVGGIPFLLQQEETGLLVRDGDVEEMAGAVLRLLQEPELCSRLSTNGRTLAMRSDAQAVRSQWEALFARVLSRSVLPGSGD